MSKQTKRDAPIPPVDDRRYSDLSKRRGKTFPPPAASWGVDHDASGAPYEPGKATRLLGESVGWEE